MSSLVTKDFVKPQPVCQLCESAEPVVFCTTCYQGICQPCKERHDKIKDFKSHGVAPLCQKHNQAVTHLCMRCMQLMCLKCMLLDHQDHDPDFADYAEGMDKLRQSLVHLHSQVHVCQTNVKVSIDKVKSRHQRITDTKENLIAKKRELAKKIAELDKLIADIEENQEKKENDILEALCRVDIKCNSIMDNIWPRGESDATFLANYTDRRENLEAVINESRLMLATKLPKLHFTDLPEEEQRPKEEPVDEKDAGDAGKGENNDRVNGDETRNIVLVISKRAMADIEMSRPEDLAMIDQDFVLVADYNLKQIIKVNKVGNIKEKYFPLEMKPIQTLTLCGNVMYIAQESTISKIPMDPHSKIKEERYTLKIGPIWNLCTVNPNTIIISDLTGKIYEYQPDTGNLRVVLEDLGGPTFVSLSRKGKEVSYIVSVNRSHSVHVYSSDWKKKASMGGFGNGDGQLNTPHGTAQMDGGRIFVADYGNNRVSCFTMDGRFVEHVLTQREHGVVAPHVLAYRDPDLWLAEYRHDHAALKRFQYS